MKRMLVLLAATVSLATAAGAAPTVVPPEAFKTTASGLKYAVLVPGKGPGAVRDQLVRVHFTGWLENGQAFTTSRTQSRPVCFFVGRRYAHAGLMNGERVFPGLVLKPGGRDFTGEVLASFDEGLLGITAGEKRQLRMPPSLAFGQEAVETVPANSPLIFEVEAVELGSIFKPVEKPEPVDAKLIKTTPSGLKYAILKEGSGVTIQRRQRAVLHYDGWLQESGKKFDSTIDRGEPFECSLGRGILIPGLEEGLEGMKTGEKRRLIIPANLAYGEAGAGSQIPPRSTIIYDVELSETRG